MYHFFIVFTYRGYHMIFLFLCLILLSMTTSRSIHVAANGIIFFSVMVNCIYVSYLLYLFLYWWTFRRRQWHPTPVLFPGESHGWRSLVGCIPWGRWELDTTERLHFHFSLSRIGEGNGNPLQCSCLENPGTGEPGELPSMGSHRVGHDWSDLAAVAVALMDI